MTMTALERMEARLHSLGPVSPEAVAEYRRAFGRILSVVEETYILEAEQPERGLSRDRLAFLRDGAGQFGRTLEAVYRFSLWDALAREAIGLARGLRSRGAGAADLSRLFGVWMMATLSAVKPPQVHELTRPLEALREEIDALYEAASPPFEGEREPVQADGAAGAFMEAVFDGDAEEAVARARAHHERRRCVEGVLDELFFPTLAAVGRRWMENRISVPQEHAATAALRAVMHRFFDSFPARYAFALRVAVTCVPGDEHDLGAEIVARYLASRGWPVYFIGRSSPEGEILRALQGGEYGAVLLSVSMVRHLPALESLAGRLRELKPVVRLVAGGGGVAAAEAVVRTMVDAVAETPAAAHAILHGMEHDGA